MIRCRIAFVSVLAAVTMAITVQVGQSSLGPVSSSGGPVFTPSHITLTPSLVSLSPTSTLTPSPTHSPPLNETPAMPIAPIIYLIAVPVALCLLLAIMFLLICCIICCYQRQRRKRHRSGSQSSKNRNSSSKLDTSKSLEAYGGNGRSSHSVAKPGEDSTKRYELQTVDRGSRFSEASVGSPTYRPSSSKTLPVMNSHSSTWSSSPQINCSPPSRPSHTHTSPLHTHTYSHHNRLQGIPEAGISSSDFRIASNSKTASLPHAYTDGDPYRNVHDPSSLYDVPASARLKNIPTYFPDPNDPQSVYDVPKGTTGLTGHPNMSPMAGSLFLSNEGLYDVPPSSATIYDVPPDVHRPYNPELEIYDVPPPSGSRPRLNSLPLSQEELLKARRSLVGTSPPDSVFVTGAAAPDYSHYDVPRHLMNSQQDMAHYQQPSGKRLSRRSSIPSHTQGNMIYDVPREARMGGEAPPTAAKPTRRVPSRSHSISSPPYMASPQRRPPADEAVYDVPPLDPELLAQHIQQTSTSSESDTSHLTRLTHQRGATSHNRVLSPSRSTKKAPPPTKRKPGRRSDSVRK